MGFSRREYWSGLPFPYPGDLLNPGIEPGSPALQAHSLPCEPPRQVWVPQRGRRIRHVFHFLYFMMLCHLRHLAGQEETAPGLAGLRDGIYSRGCACRGKPTSAGPTPSPRLAGPQASTPLPLVTPSRSQTTGDRNMP